MTRPRREYMNISAKVHPETVALMTAAKYFMESTTDFIESAILREAIRRKQELEGKQ